MATSSSATLLADPALSKKRKLENGHLDNGASTSAMSMSMSDSADARSHPTDTMTRPRFPGHYSPEITSSSSPFLSQHPAPIGLTPLDLGAQINGIPSIHTACIDGNTSLVEQLIRIRPQDVEAQDLVGSRPLHVAASSGQLNIVRLLLQYGADINARDYYQSTPVVVSTSSEVTELLVSHGAAVDARNINNISARALGHTNPQVARSIQRGLQLRERRRILTRQYILEVTNPSHRVNDSIAVTALTNLATPTFGSSLAPPLPTLSPLSLALSPALQPRELVLDDTNNHGGSSSRLDKMDEFKLDEQNQSFSQFPPSLATLIVSFLYPPVEPFSVNHTTSSKAFHDEI